MAHPYLITKRSGNTPNSSVIAQLDMRREEKLQNVTIDTGYQAGGISSVYVCRTGKNLMPRFSSYSGNGITITANTDGSLTVGGQATGTILIYSGGVSGLPDIHYRVLGGQYTISGTSEAITGTYHMCSTIRKRADWSLVTAIALDASATQQAFQIADTDDVDNVFLRFYSGAGPTGESVVLYPQLELGSEKTAYEPYRGDIYTVTLPETIYGGLIDLTNGKATSLYASDGTLLAEPVVYDITPQDITAFQGINNIWSDYGTVAVRYWSAPGEQMHPASASGSLVTIANGADARMISCMADIDAVQDLHGYSNPWPAGGGKNLLDESEMYVGYYSPTDLHFVANDAYRTAIIDELPAGTYTFSTSLSNPYLLRAFYDGTNHSATSASSSLTFTSTTSGKVMVCFRNTDTSDITETFHTQIEKGSPATSWEPYSNICPITGWTGVSVRVAKVNLFDSTDVVDSCYIKAANTSEEQPLGSEQSANTWKCSGYIQVEPNTKYVVAKDYWQSATGAGMVFYSGQTVESAISGISEQNQKKAASFGGDTYAFVTPPGCRYVRFSWSRSASVESILLAEGDNVPVTWETEAGTVYGGTIDLVSGILTVTKALLLADGSFDVYKVTKHSGGNYYVTVRNNLGAPTTNPLPISDKFKSARLTNIGNCYITSNGSSLLAFLPDQTITTKEAATQWFEDNPTQFVYDLAEPITYQLTPQEVRTIAGLNHIRADTGNAAVRYWKN